MSPDELAVEFDLTPAELRVAVALALGINAKQVAHKLKLSHHTVRQHLKTIFSKTYTNGQNALIVLVLKGPQNVQT